MTNAEDEWFYEDLQELLELTAKKKERKERKEKRKSFSSEETGMQNQEVKGYH